MIKNNANLRHPLALWDKKKQMSKGDFFTSFH